MRDNAKTHFARQLRREMTPAERYLWTRLRRRQLSGYRFRRQHPLGPYIADFACVEKRLLIEIGGSQHAEPGAGAGQDAWLRQHGFTVIRCWNHDVLARVDQVLASIAEVLASPHSDG
jgi:very-short-patch-repair endonuclease